MLIATLILLTLTGAAIFAAPLRCKAWVALAFVVLFALGGTAAAVGALAGILPPAGLSLPTLLFGEESLRMDALSALFTLLVAAGSVAAALYAKGYVDRYLDRKPAAHISLHYFAFTLLSLSMTAVVTASGGYTFLFWWELMTLSSFVLILFDAERKEVLKAALTYLVMMHLGFFALLIGFVVLQAAEGSADFGALAGYFAAHRPLPLLLVFLAGFGMKAGLFPMHVWLPEAVECGGMRFGVEVACAEEEQRFEERVVEGVQQRAGHAAQGHRVVACAASEQGYADGDEDDPDVFDRGVGQQPLDVVLHGGQ